MLSLSNQSDLFASGPRLQRLSKSIDGDGYERGERRNGATQCPKCGAWWPVVEEPEAWVENGDGEWKATEWWGAAVCELCNLLLAEQPDGQGEAYQL